MNVPNSRPTNPPCLRLSHATIAVNDLDAMLDFYCHTLGFRVTDRGLVGADGGEMAFLSQDPAEHHQVVLVSGLATGDHEFVMADHMAFRTGTLDDLRAIQSNLTTAGIDGIIPISHGNAWSLYFNDPEGNGLECFVDTPYHVAQPHAEGLDLAATDYEIAETTRTTIESLPEFQPIGQWQIDFASQLDNTPGI